MSRASLLALILLGFAPLLAADEPKPQEKLLGTWKLVSAKYGGQDFKFPEGTSVVKHITPAQFMTVIYDKDGKVSRAAGGSYEFEGEVYKETPEYSTSENFEDIKGKEQAFNCKITGKTWKHEGTLSNGLLVEEIYEKVDKR